MTDSSTMRAGDHDREAAVVVLREAYAAGRLDLAELQARIQAAYTAVTWGQLGALTADLPHVQAHAGEVVRTRAKSPAPPALGWPAAIVLVTGLSALGISTVGWWPAVDVPALLAALLILSAAWGIHRRKPGP